MSRASTDQQKKPRAKGDPFMLGLLTLAVAPAFGLGMGFGAGSVAIIGGLVALFAVIAFLGGSLRADARVIAIVTPCLFVASVGPRLLSEVSQAAAIAATVAIVFVGALLPLISPRLVNVGQGVGMATLFSYGSAVAGPYSATQLCLAVLAGLIVAIALRVLLAPVTHAGPPAARWRACWTQSVPTWQAPLRSGWTTHAPPGSDGPLTPPCAIGRRWARCAGAAASDLTRVLPMPPRC